MQTRLYHHQQDVQEYSVSPRLALQQSSRIADWEVRREYHFLPIIGALSRLTQIPIYRETRH